MQAFTLALWDKPCPETAEQNALVERWERDKVSTPSLLDSFRGCILGGAVGDALGAPVEFLTFEEIRRRYGEGGITDFDTAYGRRGAITDDTQMTLFTAEGLIRADARFRDRGICNVPRVIQRAYLRWFTTQGEQVPSEAFYPGGGPDGWLVSLPELHSRRAPGNTCLASLRSPSPKGEAQNDSKGCGAVMRMAPVGLVAAQPFDLGSKAGRITHGHPTGYLAAGYLAQLIHGIVNGCSLEAALNEADTVLASHPQHEECLAAVTQARELARAVPASHDRLATLGEGWTAEEALAIAIYCVLVSDKFAHAVTLAVNHSGDSDSTGAITGNIVGAIYGIDAIPEIWLAELELRDEIDHLAHDLHRLVNPTDAEPPPSGRTFPPY